MPPDIREIRDLIVERLPATRRAVQEHPEKFDSVAELAKMNARHEVVLGSELFGYLTTRMFTYAATGALGGVVHATLFDVVTRCVERGESDEDWLIEAMSVVDNVYQELTDVTKERTPKKDFETC